REPNIVITKTVNPASNNTTVVYDVNVVNNSLIPASLVQITDNLPGTLLAPWSAVTQILGSTSFSTALSTPTQIVIDLPIVPASSSNTFQFSADIDTSFTVGTLITNTGTVTYHSLPVLNPDVRDYTGTSSANYRRLPDLCVSVQNNVEDLNIDYNTTVPNRTETVGTIGDIMRFSGSFPVLIGQTELQTLRLQILPIPVGLTPLNNLVVFNRNDISVPIIMTAASFSALTGIVTIPINTSVNTSNQNVVYSFEYDMRIANNSNNQAGVIYNVVPELDIVVNSNTIIVSNDSSNPLCNPNFMIVEPNIQIIKSLFNFDPVYPGQTVSYSIAITNPKLSNNATSTAFSVVLNDLEFNNPNIFASLTANIVANPPGWTITRPDLANPLILTVTGEKLIPADAVNIIVTATLQDNVTIPDQYFTNNANIVYKSMNSGLDNAAVYSRNGYDGPSGLNNYNENSAATIFLASPNIAKSINKKNALLNDVLTYYLKVSLPPGNNNNIVITDVFDTNLTYVLGSSSVITTALLSDSVLSEDFDGIITAVSPSLSGNTLTWTFNTSITVNQSANPQNNSFVIKYDMLYSTQNELRRHNNTATLFYGSSQQISSSAAFNDYNLIVSKKLTAGVPETGETVEFTICLFNDSDTDLIGP
ncbi:MAG: hypothetical protein WD512_18345, partial [Candidatus Paceibacterota bacterium]